MNNANKVRTGKQLAAVLALIALFALSLGSIAQEKKSTGAPTSAARPKDVDVAEFARLAGDSNNVVLDVRTPREYAGGHLAGAMNLNLRAPDFAAQAGKLDKSKTYLVYCAVGARSASACQKLGALGFTSLVNLKTGIQGWQGAGQPVER